MRSALIALLGALAFGPAAVDDPRFDAALKQYQDGMLAEAVASFDALIRERSDDPAARARVVRAHLYKGAALVGLQQENAAKETFRLALSLDPATRIRRGDFPDRVVRVFEAARTGKTESVMERPTGAPKKAGIGAAGIAAIVGGAVVLTGGAAAVVARGGGSPPTPSPSPSTPSGTITLLATTPAAGSTVAVRDPQPGRLSNPVQLGFAVQVASLGGESANNLKLHAEIYFLSGTTPSVCASGETPLTGLVVGQRMEIGVSLANGAFANACSLPRTTTRLTAQIWRISDSRGVSVVETRDVTFTFVP